MLSTRAPFDSPDLFWGNAITTPTRQEFRVYLAAILSMIPCVDITFLLALTKFLSLIGPKESSYVGRNDHLLNVTFAALVYGGFRALPPLASGQHPLFLVKIIHSWPKLAPGLDTFAGSVFFIYDIWLNLASTYCDRKVHIIMLSWFFRYPE